MLSARALWCLVAIQTLGLLGCFFTHQRPDLHQWVLAATRGSDCKPETVALCPKATPHNDTQATKKVLLTPSWQGDITQSADDARGLLGSAGTAATADRILVPLLSSRHKQLCCFLRLFEKNVAPTTPADIFIFSVDNSAEADVTAACPLESALPHVFFMALREHWMTPWEAGPKATWVGPKSEDYRRMGHWRLLFPMAFAAELGYDYVWQLDDDSYLTKPLSTNMLEFGQKQRLLMGSQRLAREPLSVNWGLPELARSFLVSEQTPPAGPLYKHCKPQSLEGLYSTTQLLPSTGGSSQSKGGGWDRETPIGNCVLMNVAFYQSPPVQKWVRTVISSGGHFRFRWQEQATTAMIRHMFVPDNRFKLLPVNGYRHKKSGLACSKAV